MHKIAWIFPGQGAQYVGMGRDVYEHNRQGRALYDKANALLGYSLTEILFHGPKEKLIETQYSQLAIYVMSLALVEEFRVHRPHIVPFVCAGLSLGEYTALVAAGKLSFEEGLCLVEKRAKLMQDACKTSQGSMRVVLGLSEKEIAEVLQTCSSYVAIANLNCPGQTVIAGTISGLEEAAAALKHAGAKRILPMDVSGAFHSELMAGARDGLAVALQHIVLQDSPIKIVMNYSGDFVETIDEMKEHLLRQVSSPVYWQRGIEAMYRAGVDTFIEIGCGKTLQGMNKRILDKATTYSIETLKDLQQEMFDE